MYMGQFFNAPDEQPPLVADTEHRIFQIFNHFIWHTFPWTMPQGFRRSPLDNSFLVTCRNVRYVNIDYNIRRIKVLWDDKCIKYLGSIPTIL